MTSALFEVSGLLRRSQKGRVNFTEILDGLILVDGTAAKTRQDCMRRQEKYSAVPNEGISVCLQQLFYVL